MLSVARLYDLRPNWLFLPVSCGGVRGCFLHLMGAFQSWLPAAGLPRVHLLSTETCRVPRVLRLREGGRKGERDHQVIFNFPHQLITLLCAGDRWIIELFTLKHLASIRLYPLPYHHHHCSPTLPKRVHHVARSKASISTGWFHWKWKRKFALEQVHFSFFSITKAQILKYRLCAVNILLGRAFRILCSMLFSSTPALESSTRAQAMWALH